ncbi:hypothetical protein [Methylobacter sp.]|uniref:hypothetical protein n=1 Tax=Methylobacter sp. TaxID=2051955 RepID=UPI0011FFDDBF|nr:hypothetical protein [Methylobacter sp.]TAK60000.1 MAG: hypothetical protein EPO18_18840 [Methylobacter sp.]
MLGVPQFGPQIVGKQVGSDLIEGFFQGGRFIFEGNPDGVAASDIFLLRTGFAALAFLGACQLFEFAVKFFDLPGHVIQLMGDGPVNVVVWGDQLEQFDLERYFFSLTPPNWWSRSDVHSTA